MASKHHLRQTKTEGELEESSCQYVEQAENCEKSPIRSTLVVGRKSNGKSQINSQ